MKIQAEPLSRFDKALGSQALGEIVCDSSISAQNDRIATDNKVAALARPALLCLASAMSCRTFIAGFGLFIITACPSLADESAVPRFETDVQPILERRCAKCHSDTHRKADLDVTSPEGLRTGGESGEPLIADTAEDGLLWSMISSGQMPPDGNPTLTEKERAVIYKWLATQASNEINAAAESVVDGDSVMPILLLRCAACHGATRQDGGLDIRDLSALTDGSARGPVVVIGDPDSSPLIRRIESRQCPPGQLLLKFFVRRPTQSEIDTLRRWIVAGAPDVPTKRNSVPQVTDPLVTEKDRQHWAFRPPQRPGQGSSVDDFIRRRLEENGLAPAPEADRSTLIRRAYIDLHGLPPSLQQQNTWNNYNGPGWYEAMIDELLASSRYGERWGRYWLDVAGYADSEGGVSADPVRPVAWKYRDYVVRSFNSNKPFDRFLTEQIAGDELIDVANAPEVTREMVDCLTATGFLRMGIDQTGSRTMNFVPERLGVIDDALKVLGSGVLGLSISCARCHSHK